MILPTEPSRWPSSPCSFTAKNLSETAGSLQLRGICRVCGIYGVRASRLGSQCVGTSDSTSAGTITRFVWKLEGCQAASLPVFLFLLRPLGISSVMPLCLLGSFPHWLSPKTLFLLSYNSGLHVSLSCWHID